MKKKIITSAILAIAATILVGCSGGNKLDAVDINDKEEFHYFIENGSNLTIVANDLEDLGYIKNAKAMIKYAKENNLTNIKVGEYIINKSMTPVEIANDFSKGNVYKGTKIVVQEGLEAVQIAKKIEDAGLGKADVFMELVSNPKKFADKYEFLRDEKVNSLEGYLYPLTYHFKESDTEETIIDKMLSSFNKIYISDLQPNLEKSKYSLNDVVILASIVEREAALEEEMPMVASVFENRLDINMPLQSCATVQYIIKERKWILSYEEISIDSPYNTYKYNGLPISAIASPSLKAMLAVMNHEKTDYIYFLSKNDGTGSQVFAETYEEHLANKKKYLG